MRYTYSSYGALLAIVLAPGSSVEVDLSNLSPKGIVDFGIYDGKSDTAHLDIVGTDYKKTGVTAKDAHLLTESSVVTLVSRDDDETVEANVVVKYPNQTTAAATITKTVGRSAGLTKV
jgi:hypothetical protein